jgi:ABC-type Fe3+-siderophore transport system permease subunit
MPSPRLTPKVARLLGLQMFAVVAALLAVLAFVLFNTRPNRPGTTGGIDPINVTITWIAFAFIVGALIYIHVNFARQLLGESRGARRGVETW